MSYSSSLQNGNGPIIPPNPNQGQYPSFSVTNTASFPTTPSSSRQTTSATPMAAVVPPTPGPSKFKAPAHKHAHHLHSIPPREKSTRTLIIDHMLWVHGRTRFAQARAELGMTDRTGGPSSPHYSHRERPEIYEEEEEVISDGEDVGTLKAREGGPGHTHNDEEDDRIEKQELVLARSLRLRAEGLEKVVTSMLDQPPPVHPILDDDPLAPPTSPKQPHSHNHLSPSHPHTLPNGVRLRLALGTVINDLFARQAPPPPYRHHHHPPPIIVSGSVSDSGGLTPGNSPVMQKATTPSSMRGSSVSSTGTPAASLPPSLVLLSSISAAPSIYNAPLPSRNDFRLSTSPSQPSPLSGAPLSPHWRTHPVPSGRVRALYVAGADPSTANSPPGLRCPRHLHTGCEICVEAKQPVRAPGGPGRVRAPSSATPTNDLNSRSNNAGRGGMMIGSMVGGGSSMTGMGGSGGGITGWQDGSGIGSGLARPGVRGSVLRRKSKTSLNSREAEAELATGTGAGNTRLSELIPRFIRLSALVALELGREVGEEEYGGSERAGGESDDERRGNGAGGSGMSINEDHILTPSSPASVPSRRDIYSTALRPSREWYMLLGGLLTRAALEGYLTGGWRGLDAVECLLAVGLGIGASDDHFEREWDDEDDMLDWFDPDDLPNLKESTRIMFPALQARRTGVPLRREGAEAEFETEMEERLRRFYAIPSLTPDLSTHMEDLAWHYPAEPVERAALRFCEAIAKWRGKPELETYKKKSSQKEPATPGTSTMTIESLVHSNPPSPTTSRAVPPSSSTTVPPFDLQKHQQSLRPPIEKYFSMPSSAGGWRNMNKRRRSVDEDRTGKRVHG